MQETASVSEFSSDAPLPDCAGDRLNRAPFAKRLASVIACLPRGCGMVIGIHGPWGDGKTTVLNMLRSQLSSNPGIVIRDFNPWRMVSDDALARGFFGSVSEAIGQSLKTNSEKAKQATRKWAGVLRVGTKPAAVFFKTADSIDKFLETYSNAQGAGDSIQVAALRERLIEELKSSSVRVVILVDDIDRLDRDETHMLFRLVKACADFPNICYCLAFDDEAVARVLEERYGGDGAGRAFLEKIVQIPLPLPAATSEDLRDLCLEEVDKALTAAGIRLETKEIGEFISGFDRGLSARLSTPREAKRFGNGLLFTLPLLKGEASIVDLLLLEGLRAFYPEVYAVIRENHADFSGVEGRPMQNDARVPRCRELLDPIAKPLSTVHVDALIGLLKELFPRLNMSYGGTRYGPDTIEKWTREKRVASPIYCQRYFSYAVPGSDIADAEMAQVLELASQQDGDGVAEQLGRLLVGRRARRVLEKLRAVEDSVDAQSASVLCVCLAGLGARLPSPAALFSFAEPMSQAGILISRLLRRISDRAARFECARSVLRFGEPLWFAAECLRWMYITDKPDQQDKNALSVEDRDSARNVVVERVKALAQAGAILFEPSVPNHQALLYEWRESEGREPVQQYLTGVFECDRAQVGKFLDSMTPRAWTSGSATPHVSDLRIEQLNNIEHLIDLDVLATWIRKSCEGNLDNPAYDFAEDVPIEQRLAEQFLYCLMKKREAAKSHAD